MQKIGIVWLASYPRSGNTWLRLFLHSLLEVMAGRPDDAVQISEIGKYSTWEADARNFAPFVDAPDKVENLHAVIRARPKVQAAMLARQGRSFFAKTHLLLATLDGTPTINPDVTKGAVYIVRDPRDVACSFAAHVGAPLDEIIERMAMANYAEPNSGAYEVMGSWSRNVETWTDPPRDFIHVVRYRDLVARPMETFAAIARHVSLAPSPEQLERAIRLSSFDRLRGQEVALGLRGASERSTDYFFRRGKVGTWRDELTSAQADRIVRDHREQMVRFGYL